MVADDKEFRTLGLPDTLELSTDHTVRVVGHLLRRHYQDQPEAAVPEKLQDLLDALDAGERDAMHASKR